MRGRDEAGTLAGDAYAVIHKAISSGVLAPGQRLRFAELQSLCGMSVTPVREALARLTAEGFTVSEDRRGFRVAPLSLAELQDITSNRKLLEGEALRLSILRGDAEWESRVIAAHHLMTRIPRERDDIPSAVRDEWERKHAAFHKALISACGSPILMEICERLFAKADRYRRMSISIPGQNRDVAREHEDILRLAISRQSEQAVNALQQHYQMTADAVQRLFQATRPEM